MLQLCLIGRKSNILQKWTEDFFPCGAHYQLELITNLKSREESHKLPDHSVNVLMFWKVLWFGLISFVIKQYTQTYKNINKEVHILKKGTRIKKWQLYKLPVPFVSFVNRGMSCPECDSDPWACYHGNRERQLDALLPRISEEEERKCPHPSLVLFSSCCTNSHPSSHLSVPLSSCPWELSVSDCEDGHKENEAVWELHPSIPPAKVSSVWGNRGRSVPVVDSQCDRNGPGFLHL